MKKNLQHVVNDRIRFILKNAGKNQEWLSVEAEISKGHLSELLNMKQGKRWNVDLIHNVCAALNIPAWHLLTDPEEVYPSHDKAVVSAYLSLEDDERKIVDKFLFPGEIRPHLPENPSLTDPDYNVFKNKQMEQKQ